MSEPQLNAVEANQAAPVEEIVAEKETMPSLEELLRQAELQAQEHHDAWLRAKAEADNARRRAADEVEKARKFALEKFSKE